MYTDATPSTGPFKSYAQVVKEPCPPQTQQPPRRHIEIIPDDDDWTDVSSVTSCGWPRSVETDCTFRNISSSVLHLNLGSAVFSDDSHSLSHLIKNAKRNSPNPIVEMPEDVPWIDQEIDTRVPHAFAGQIKHCNRSRWRYTNIRPQAVFCGYINEEELLKPWRTFPGDPINPCHGVRCKLLNRCGRVSKEVSAQCS